MIINIFPNENFLFSNLMTNTWPLQMLVKSREAYCMIHTCEHVSKDQNQLLLQSAVCESLTASTIIWLAFITMVNYKTLITKWILLIFNPFQISDLDFRLGGDYVFSMLRSNFYQIIHFLCGRRSKIFRAKSCLRTMSALTVVHEGWNTKIFIW